MYNGQTASGKLAVGERGTTDPSTRLRNRLPLMAPAVRGQEGRGGDMY